MENEFTGQELVMRAFCTKDETKANEQLAQLFLNVMLLRRDFNKDLIMEIPEESVQKRLSYTLFTVLSQVTSEIVSCSMLLTLTDFEGDQASANRTKVVAYVTEFFQNQLPRM